MTVKAGMKFGFLTAQRATQIDGRAHWVVRCTCGNTKTVQTSQLTRSCRPTRSCGCRRKELVSQTHFKKRVAARWAATRWRRARRASWVVV